MSVGLQIAGTVGMCLSLYAMYVEYKHEEEPTYEAVCDINEHMSCSRVLTSEWSHIISHLGILPRGHPLDFANATLGLLYFSFVTLHRLLPVTSHCVSARVVFFVTLPVVAISVYLAYILFAVLQDICLLCMSIYGINLTVLVLSYRQSFRSAGAVGNQVSPVASKADEAKSD